MATDFYTNATRFKNRILWRGYAAGGGRLAKDISYQPTLYVPNSKFNTGWKTLVGEYNVVPRQFDSIWKAESFLDEMEQHKGAKVFGSRDWISVFLNERFPDMVVDHNLIKTIYIDIETATTGGYGSYSDPWQPITAISVCDGKRFFALGLKPYVVSPNEQYICCPDEATLLSKFIALWTRLDADIVTGWNSNDFDLPYLTARIDRVLGDGESNRLSPWGLPARITEAHTNRGLTILSTSIPGIECIDYLDLYRNIKFVPQQCEEYSLDFIANMELGEGKVDYHDEYGTLENLYNRNHQLFVEYNIRDSRLVRDLDYKKQFINVIIASAYDAKVNYKDAMGSVRIWESIIHNHLIKDQIVVPVKPKNIRQHSHAIAGAYVKNPKPNVYKWVASFDASSLYPSLIRQLNISPETFKGIQYTLDPTGEFKDKWAAAELIAKRENWTIAGNGAAFDRSKQGILPRMMKLYYDRKEEFGLQCIAIERQLQKEQDLVKRKQLQHSLNVAKTNRHAIKLQLNSAYGATNNKYFLFFDPQIGEAVTLSGQVLIRHMADCANQYLNKVLATKDHDYVIASDTDSIIVELDRFVQNLISRRLLNPNDKLSIVKILSRFCDDKLKPVLHAGLDNLSQRSNQIENAVRMDREVIADRAVWVAAKNYMMRVLDMKGVTYLEPHYKIMGLETVRSSTPTLCRNALNDAVKLILDGDQSGLKHLVNNFRAVYYKGAPSDVGKNTKVSKLRYYSTQPHMPKQVRAALLYNKLIESKYLQQKYSLIQESSKIRLLDLLMPNPYSAPSIGFPSGVLPPELQLEAYIDYSGMFETYFLNPLRRMAAAAHINLNTNPTMDDLFA